jgi:hypothetical protein
VPVPAPTDLPDDTRVKTLSGVVTVTDPQDEILIEHARPPPGVGYVGNGRHLGPPNHRSVTDVLRHELSPMS